MFPTKLNSRKGLFLNKHPTASIVHPEFEGKFSTNGSWIGSRLFCQAQFQLPPENIQTEAFWGYLNDDPYIPQTKFKGCTCSWSKIQALIHLFTHEPSKYSLSPCNMNKGDFYIDKATLIRISRILSKCRQGKSFPFNPHILNRNIILGLGISPGTNAVHFHTAISSF